MKNLSTQVLFAAVLGAAMNFTALVQAAPESELLPFVKDFLGQVDFVEERILALNQAMAAKEDWRPADGVRSVSETYLHIAFANYLLPKVVGLEPPAAANFSMDLKKWDTQTTEAARINDILKASFDNVRNMARKVTAAQMDKKVDFFGHEMTGRNMMITVLNHMHEHLGQSIAYARMNGVVPPWTAAEQAADKTKPEKPAN
ncbi:MAG: DinB family protein [Verrucomicrobiota bacterium]|nr:DinB family protein [Verrucomicrobiota bacterium]